MLGGIKGPALIGAGVVAGEYVGRFAGGLIAPRLPAEQVKFAAIGSAAVVFAAGHFGRKYLGNAGTGMKVNAILHGMSLLWPSGDWEFTGY